VRLPDRKESEARRLLEAGPHVPVPTGLAERARLRGQRLTHRRRMLRAVLWLTVLGALTAFALWVSFAEPWTPPPSSITPPLGW